MTPEEKRAYMRRYNKRYYNRNGDSLKMRSEKYRKTNPEKVRAGKAKWYQKLKGRPDDYAAHLRRIADARLKRKYSITLEEYERMCQRQNGECGICGRKAKLVIDHDHSTGRIRGLLCRACNGFLGMLGDGVAAIKALSDYLEE